MLFHDISALVYNTNSWFGNTGPLQEVKMLKSLTHECIIKYIKFWMFFKIFLRVEDTIPEPILEPKNGIAANNFRF